MTIHDRPGGAMGVDSARRVVGVGAGLAAVAVLVVLMGSPAGARPEPAVELVSGVGERIDRYDVAIEIRSDGTLRVVETIDYNFNVRRHGIFRDVLVRARFDGRYDRVTPIDVVSVDGSPGTPDEYVLEWAERVTIVGDSPQFRFRRIKIGDPDRTITGAHSYEITYTVEGALTGFEDHDELFWNAIGPGWDVPINDASVTVAAPAGITDEACFAGAVGSRLACSNASVPPDGDTARFSDSGLPRGGAFTVVVAFPKGAVPEPEPILIERWSFTRAFALTPVTVSVSGVLLVVVVGLVGGLLWVQGRDRRFVGSATDVAFGSLTGAFERVPLRDADREIIPVQFVPPEGLRPGQVGTLMDEVAHPVDVTATIVDLAARGYLTIEDVGAGSDWRLRKTGAASKKEPLDDYERILFNGVFEDGDDVRLSSLKQHFRARMKRVQDALYDDMVDRGWYTRRPDTVRRFWLIVGAVATVAAVLVFAGLVAYTRAALIGVPLVLGAVVLLAGSRRMPHRTPTGTGVMRRLLGFRRFIEESEGDRAAFAEKLAFARRDQRPETAADTGKQIPRELFTEYLPYAIVFGATDKWARAFDGLDEGLPQPSWYISPHPFNVLAFSSDMDGFSSTATGVISAMPASSGGGSGFGGGGFSGGGGGGGGGGSW